LVLVFVLQLCSSTSLEYLYFTCTCCHVNIAKYLKQYLQHEVSFKFEVFFLQLQGSPFCNFRVLKKGKGFPYSIPSVGPGADPGVQAVSLQVTVSHPPGSRLPLFSARPAVTSPAAEHHPPLAGTKLYCLVTEAHRCKQLA